MAESKNKRSSPAQDPEGQSSDLPTPDEERAIELPIEEGDSNAQTL